jgi:hypothetical protein
MTSDGIRKRDWDAVRAQAARVANAFRETDRERQKAATQRMRDLLGELKRTYGNRPSLLATEADYCSGTRRRRQLLRAAYREAARIHDSRNAVMISADLAELAIEQASSAEAQAWLERLSTHLRQHRDPSDSRRANALRRAFRRMTARRISGLESEPPRGASNVHEKRRARADAPRSRSG